MVSSKMFRKVLFALLLLLALNVTPSNAQNKELEKVGRLMEWTSKKPIIRMNGDMFNRFVKESPRNYSVVVMFTAVKQQSQCGICKEALAEFRELANAWRHSPDFSNKVFFATVDIDEASDVFEMFKLDHVPSILHFPSQGKPDHYEMNRGIRAEQLARWVADQTDVRIHVIRPPDYTTPLSWVVVFSLVGGLAYYKHGNFSFILNENIWSVATLCCVLLLISGERWSHIRGAPFAYRNHASGQQTFIHPSTQAQFGAETYIVTFFNAGALVGIVLLCEAANGGQDTATRKAMCLGGKVMVMIFFACLLSVFRVKH